eukprot:m.129358 g.129358  ORF g.129358 m.129358 type:complete len:105 (+) comp13672_c0_seq2:2715-3029(+)
MTQNFLPTSTRLRSAPTAVRCLLLVESNSKESQIYSLLMCRNVRFNGLFAVNFVVFSVNQSLLGEELCDSKSACVSLYRSSRYCPAVVGLCFGAILFPCPSTQH